ncbi:hypothetical protein BUALT_Bualt01G0212600 [Buddleja alternifolia]|uniref:LOB domain-containing protein n=1 Tax=Buddleja alternifolia TaxID=168488 RepID=A0AAV6YFE6_9LAMI|nr:hypothetical protein BUALT_Bualt01G0212600 [Buddleja alternifolia]
MNSCNHASLKTLTFSHEILACSLHFLRRKCVKGCIFAPYFDSDQGTAHFAAVHRVFGASNASKLLLRIPTHCRLDAVITLCYEALARVVNLQAELAYVQARISTLQRAPQPPCLSSPDPRATSAEMVSFCNSFDHEHEVIEEDIGDLQSVAREYVSSWRFDPSRTDL